MQIHGHVAHGFERVADAFRNNFLHHGDIGASCCIYYQGKPVVDIWSGMADPLAGKAWAEDTIQLCFSASKGITTLCVLTLVEQELLDLDRPIADYWPEFGCAGKQHISTRMVLSHRAGLAAIDGELTLAEVLAWQPVVDAIARQAPNWEPGTTHGYHTRAFGWILGEIVRRITGKTLGEYLASQVTGPLHADFHIGLPASELHRCARLMPDTRPLFSAFVPTPLTLRSLTGPSNLFSYNEMWNDKALLMAEMPSSNGVGNGRSLAKLYAAMIGEIDGIQLLEAATLAEACRVHSRGTDAIIPMETCFGLGFMLPPWLIQYECGPRSFGHTGAGGSFAMADPDQQLAFGYVMNQMSMSPDDRRSVNLVAAMYASL